MPFARAIAHGLARLVVAHRRSDLARERHGRGDEPDLAVLVLDVELDRVQTRAAELHVLLELPGQRRQRDGDVHAAHLGRDGARATTAGLGAVVGAAVGVVAPAFVAVELGRSTSCAPPATAAVPSRSTPATATRRRRFRRRA
jgi:hypothetical protein